VLRRRSALGLPLSRAEARGAGALPVSPAQDDQAPPDEADENPRSALKLYRLCKAEANQLLTWCQGYLLGLADVFVAMGNSQIAGGICDAEYGPATLGRVFEIWVERNPERSQEDMMIAAQAAFREIWPCK
jgi:Rap1a immunity proteins